MSSDKRKSLTAKEYLEQLAVINDQINQNLELLDEMKTDASSVSGIDYSRERVQTSTLGDKLCKDVTRYIAFNDHINEEIDLFVNAKEQIIGEIRGLRDRNSINILFKVYVQFKSVKQASQEMKKSYNYAISLHNQALKTFEKTYKNLHYLT